jgi:hypothetical protein
MLWTILGNVPASSDQQISPDVRAKLDALLTEWYHEKSGALFLSWPAAEKFLIVLDITRNNQAADRDLRNAMSELRTRLKRDCGIYGPFDVGKQLPSPRPRLNPTSHLAVPSGPK